MVIELTDLISHVHVHVCIFIIYAHVYVLHTYIPVYYICIYLCEEKLLTEASLYSNNLIG